MKKITCFILCFVMVILWKGHEIAYSNSNTYRYSKGTVLSSSFDLAMDYLTGTMDTFHNTFDVYTDLSAAGNHFPTLTMVPDDNTRVGMDQCCIENPFSGSTCIQCTFQSQGNNYGGYYFLNGILTGDETEPQANWGDEPGAGFDLSGAAGITFYARGKTGSEKVEFFVGGVGWKVDWQGNSTTPEKPFPDSFPKVRTGVFTLGKEWKQYTIDLQGQDLSYVLSGFGWVVTAADNNYKNITFYIDEIQWVKPRLEELRLLVSYETDATQEAFDVVMRNVAFSYDNALALLAFLASGTEDDLNRAATLADGLVHAIHNDRYYTGKWLRNAYMGGDLKQFPGWTPNNHEETARMPGFWDCEDETWYEDSFQVSTHTGNVAWVIIALLSSYKIFGDNDYLQAATELAEWVEFHCKDTRGNNGYTGGYEGWEPDADTLLYKSTEHNLDLYVVFQRLFEITSDDTWRQRAVHAETFIKSMWDETEGKFYTGTDNTGVKVNDEVIPLDAQTWAVLAFCEKPELYTDALEYAEVYHRVGEGYDFNTDRDGIWYEGTAQMAVAYQAVGNVEKANACITAVEKAQFENGAIPAASRDGLTTGFYLSSSDNSQWLYYKRGHVGATAWYMLAKQGVNPYWIGADTSSSEISLNRHQLNFGYVIGGNMPDTQKVTISNTGKGTMNWTVTGDADWLSCSPDSGTNSGVITVTVDPTGLEPGVYTDFLTVTALNATNAPQTVSVYLNVKAAGTDEAPIGSFDTPIDGSTVCSSVPFTGWALDDTGIESVKIYRKQGSDLVYIGDTLLVEGARPDIEQAFPSYPKNYQAGWGYMMLTNFLPNQGNGIFKMVAVARDLFGHEQILGTKTLTCDNANAAKPFGAIDTPVPGETVNGNNYRNIGWALTPPPNKIPEDGSTFRMYIDGIKQPVNAVYNIARSDIAALFPGYANSEGALAYFDFDTTEFSNGVHTIHWMVMDDADNADGIGSRYFNIQNSGGSHQREAVSGQWSIVSDELFRLPVDDSSPVGIIKGFNRNAEPFESYPDRNGIITVKITELERLEIRLFPEGTAGLALLYNGYQVIGDRLVSLPIGSTLDWKRGVFYWQPGPGFIGNYRFVIIERDQNQELKKRYLHITIGPKEKW